MRNKYCLLFSLLLCLALAGCTEDNNGTARTPSDAGDNPDVADVTDAAEDSSGADGSQDSGPVECTSDNDCTAAANQVGICDTGTNTCTYACNEGFDDCDGDASNGCEVDISSSIDHCGACGNVCNMTSLKLLPVCADDGCDVDPTQCAQGYVNLDGDSSNGCECEITDADDVPNGQDTNCDGVDGIIDNAVFVSTGGDDDGNDGLSPDAPLASIGAGLQAAADKGRDYLLVSGGVFEEAVSLKAGISIYGGYDADNGWTRDTANQETRIEPPSDAFPTGTDHYKTISATSISNATVLDHLTIVGADATTPGASSYALWASDSDALVLQDSQVIAGHGAAGDDGAAGETGIARRQNGACSENDGGTPGISDDTDSPCALGSGSTAPNGLEGHPKFGAGGDGGAGGPHACKDSASACSGLSGSGGQPGVNADPATHGTPATDSLGMIDGGDWNPLAQQAPADGERGSAGGGGGAGGNCEDIGDCGLLICGSNVIYGGGNGGAGGDGGCGGGAAQNGQHGGGAFGIFAVDSDLDLQDVSIAMGSGGDGGRGGDGGEGELGQSGDSGASGANTAGRGGNGGDGGHGGHGGAGAGGCGGPSVGLVLSVSVIDQSSVNINQATGQPGQPGDGGQRDDGETADEGCDGEIQTVHDFSADTGN
jgi:hypothetical protein